MTKAESRALFLRHLDRATRQGEPLSNGSTADLLDRHDFLLSHAIADLGAALRPRGLWRIAPADGQRVGGYRLCELPEDFVSLCELRCDGLLVEGHVLLPDYLSLPGRYEGDVCAEYVRRPAPIPPDADDGAIIDLPDEAVHLVPLSCAVLATAAGDPDISAWLLALYSQSLAALTRPGLLERPKIDDRYRLEV